MKVLLVLNYQREVPPFMISEIKCAEKIFDKIEYITPKLYNDNSCEIISKKVSVVQLGNVYRYRAFLKMPFAIFRYEVRKDILKAIHEKRFGKRFLNHLFHELIPGEINFIKAKKIIQKRYQLDDIYVMSTWFDCNSYTAARLKSYFPKIKAVSLAHSFEVQREKNDFVDLSLNNFKHTYLDKVTFISVKVMKEYQSIVTFLSEEDIKKMDVHYLGSKNSKDISGRTSEDEFNLLSCSGMTPVKRINLIMDALEEWKEGTITWTHIGDGPLEKEIYERADQIRQMNNFVTIHFTGKYPNYKVHDYLKNNPVDLFINVSRSEGLPVSIMEAISYGIPVIATDVGGTSEIVNSKDGILLDAECDGTVVREKIEYFKKLPLLEKEKMRQNAKQIWCENFDMDINMSAYYKEILAL